MKHTISFVFVLSLILFSGNVSFGQTNESPAGKADARTKIMTCELNLTADEIPKVYAVNLQTAVSIDSVSQIISDYSKKKKIMTKLDKKRDANLRLAMTDEHFVFYLRLVDEDPQALKQTKACRETKSIW